MTKLKNTTETPIAADPLLGNVFIAKFMGGHENPQHRWYNVIAGDKGYRIAENFEFHKNWSWLMPVVEKINKRDWVTIYNDECKIHALVNGEFETIDIINEGQPLIKSVFEAVAKYAEWHLLNVA